MQRFLMVIFLEGYAIFLALMQSMNGVRTDEAKYLLNIPYPHPPLVRWIIGQTEWMGNQELFWRIVFATLLIQAVWVVWNLDYFPSPSRVPPPLGEGREGGVGRGDKKMNTRIILSISWLLSASLWIEGGKILMAPLTAIQGLILVCVYFWCEKEEVSHSAVSSGRIGMKNYELWIGLLWLVSLFTAYQAVLFLPIVIAIFWRMKIPVWHKFLYLGGPLVVLVLYTLTNPLVIASMVNIGGQQVSVPLLERLRGIFDLWLIGGSVMVGVLGVLGMIHTRNIPLMTSLVLVCVYIFFAHRAYYSVLFLPLLIGGMVCLLIESKIPVCFFVGLTGILWITFALQHPFDPTPNLARQILPRVPQELGAGDILIAGTFGHEWQYGTDVPVRRYKPELLSKAQAAVCLSPCAEIEWRGWKRILDGTVRIYVPRESPLPGGRGVTPKGTPWVGRGYE